MLLGPSTALNAFKIATESQAREGTAEGPLMDPARVRAATESLVAIRRSHVALAAAANPASLQTVRTDGHTTEGDGGGGDFRRVSTPTIVKPWHRQDALLATWELNVPRVRPEQLGARNDGGNNAAPAVQAAFDYITERLGRDGIVDLCGNYRFDGPVNVAKSGAVAAARSHGEAQVFRNFSVGPLFQFKSPGAAPLYRVGIQNVQLWDQWAGTRFSNAANSPYGVNFDNVDFPVLDDVLLGFEGVQMLSCTNGHFRGIRSIFDSGKAYEAGRRVLHIGGSAIVGAAAYGGNLQFMGGCRFQGGGILAGALVPRADEAVLITACDGVWFGADTYMSSTAIANLRLKRTVAAQQLTNVMAPLIFLDHAAGNALLIDGTEIVAQCHLNLFASQINLGTAGTSAIAVYGPTLKTQIHCYIQGMKGHGVHVNHANAVLNIFPSEIIEMDSDDNGDGDGIYLQACQRVRVSGGTIGGDGTTQTGVRIGAGARNVRVAGVSASDCDGWGCQIDNGAENIRISRSCDFAGNASGAVLNNASAGQAVIDHPGGTILRASTTWTPGTIANGAIATTTLSVPGAAVADDCEPHFAGSRLGCEIDAVVSAAGTVTVTLFNRTGASQALSVATTVTVEVRKLFI